MAESLIDGGSPRQFCSFRLVRILQSQASSELKVHVELSLSCLQMWLNLPSLASCHSWNILSPSTVLASPRFLIVFGLPFGACTLPSSPSAAICIPQAMPRKPTIPTVAQEVSSFLCPFPKPLPTLSTDQTPLPWNLSRPSNRTSVSLSVSRSVAEVPPRTPWKTMRPGNVFGRGFSN